MGMALSTAQSSQSFAPGKTQELQPSASDTGAYWEPGGPRRPESLKARVGIVDGPLPGHRATHMPIASAGRSRCPVQNSQPFEGSEVLGIGRHDRKAIRGRNRGDLPVDEGRRLSELFETNAFVCMPNGRALVIGKRGNRGKDDLLEKFSQFGATLASGQAPDAESKFMPCHRGHRATASLVSQLAKHALVGPTSNGERDGARVEQEYRPHHQCP